LIVKERVSSEDTRFFMVTINAIVLDSMKFGSITLVIQDGKIIQLERNEKVRLR